MKFTLDRMPIQLSRNASLNLSGGKGSSIRVVRGRVWLTEEGSPDDFFLDSGALYTFDHDGKVIISAEGLPGRHATVVFDAALAVEGRWSFTEIVRRVVSTFRNARPGPALGST